MAVACARGPRGGRGTRVQRVQDVLLRSRGPRESWRGSPEGVIAARVASGPLLGSRTPPAVRVPRHALSDGDEGEGRGSAHDREEGRRARAGIKRERRGRLRARRGRRPDWARGGAPGWATWGGSHSHRPRSPTLPSSSTAPALGSLLLRIRFLLLSLRLVLLHPPAQHPHDPALAPRVRLGKEEQNAGQDGAKA